MKSENKSSLAILIAVALLSATAGLGCSSETSPRDEQLERKIIDVLLTHKSDDVSKIDMNKVVGSEWRKICIQGPYAFQDGFEQKANEKVNGYEYLDSEQFNNIWIFYKNNTSRFAKIPRGAVMDKFAGDHTLKQTLCTTSSNPFLYLRRQYGVKKYFFNSDGE